jgi:hypothetical protein
VAGLETTPKKGKEKTGNLILTNLLPSVLTAALPVSKNRISPE